MEQRIVPSQEVVISSGYLLSLRGRKLLQEQNRSFSAINTGYSGTQWVVEVNKILLGKQSAKYLNSIEGTAEAVHFSRRRPCNLLFSFCEPWPSWGSWTVEIQSQVSDKLNAVDYGNCNWKWNLEPWTLHSLDRAAILRQKTLMVVPAMYGSGTLDAWSAMTASYSTSGPSSGSKTAENIHSSPEI